MSDTLIGTLNEKPLHAALKAWYAQPGDQFEVAIDGFVVDIVRGDLLIEIQTRSFTAMKRKLRKLTQTHPVRLVYPIAQEKWITKLEKDGVTEGKRRKSPKRGRLIEIFAELVSFPDLLAHPNFTLDVLLTQEEEVRHYDPKRGWRRQGWITDERRLIQVIASHQYETVADILHLLPSNLMMPFTTADLATATGQSRNIARRMAYCLRKMGGITPVGKQGNAILYERTRDSRQ
ncbi:MAG: hypothetical protein JXA33_13100 [Anaerolineae bacterium]|nr:hypothetical protein [Anaerolineae bacterium]